jgi:hypothetical protein
MKLFFLSLLFLLINFPASAQITEWIDSNYDFTKAKSICIDYVAAPEIVDGIRDKESHDVFFEETKKVIVDKLPKYKVDSINAAKKNFSGESHLFEKYLTDNYDLLVKCTVLQYDTGKKHVESHIYSVTVPVTTTVLGAFGQPETITTMQQQEYKIPEGDYPAAFVQVKFDVVNTKTNQSVWSWEDKQDKVDDTGISNIKPKGIFTGIISDFATNLRKNLKSRKAGGPKLSK